jgi:hypothetical protein
MKGFAMLCENDFPLSIRGRMFSLSDIETIRHITGSGAFTNRAAIAREVCRALNWYRENGQLKDASCRYALLKLHRNNLIKLPPPRRNPFEKRTISFTENTEEKQPIDQNAGKLKPLTFQLVTEQNQFKLWKEYVERYHYLGYKVIVGPQLKYFVISKQNVIACMAFGGAAWAVEPRDSWIGWNNQARKQNLNRIINNVRFLILPWISSKNLASTILSQASRTVPVDWQNIYGYMPLLMETFVDKERFDGASYKAANWIYVGDTKGRGKVDRFNKYPSSIKKIFIYPLSKKCKSFLCDGVH